MENLQGTLLKGYKLEERIGAGGFGAVYRAKQTTIGREVAVKIILPGYANNPDFIRRFESEAHLIARLEHPHITPLHDFWRDPDGAYLVMRFLRNGSIRDALDAEPYELPVISQLLDQIASGLDFAHRNDVIHRDIKPGNILLDEDGNAYLADFGIAKDLAGITDNNTAVDAVVGSLDYISPEQARSEPVTPRTDIYSLGVTLYEMITGEHPYKNISTIERLYKHINDPLPEITSLPADLQNVINDIIQKATAKDPEDRYPDVLALAVAFREGIGRDVSQQDVNVVEQLTMREHEVLALIAKGLSNRDIAAELVVSIGTVKWHINSLYKKLAVRSRVQAIVRARELNLITNGHTTDELPLVTEQSISISLPEPENPYKGLHSFQMTDARDFFGRDDLVTKLIDQMTDPDPFHRFISIVGPSGSGKSSLAKAGLIPALWKGAITGSEKWFVVDMIPGTHPMDKLETALIRVAANQTSQLREQLQRDERGLLRVADIILPGDDTELVIVVDQFEEVFTLVEDEQARQRFLDLLRVAVSDVRSRVRVIVTLRADYYDRPLHYPEFGELIRSRMETVLPLTAKGLERAVRGPAERVGMTFEQGLVEQIVSQMNYQAGALPLLQYALTELFDRRSGRILTNEAYQEIGGAVGALANRADEIYRGLTEEAQELAHQMFMRLVTLGEGAEDTRRRVTHAEFLSLTDNTDLMEEIIDQFSAYRLLSLDHDPETRQPTVEVAHEAILREWDRLRQWLNESRDDIRQERTVSRAAEEWNIHRRDASYLLRGARLEQVEKWRMTSSLIQTPLEQDFITHSLNQHEIERQDEIERKQRETQLEQRSRNFLRGLVAVFAIATVIAGGLFLLAQRESDRANNALVDAEQSASEFRSIALTFGAKEALDDNQPDVALALAQEATNMDSPPNQAQQTFRTVSKHNWMQKRFAVSNTNVRDAVYHPDGKRMITTSADGRTVLWDIETEEALQSIEREGIPIHVAVHQDGHLVAIGGDNGLVQLWNIDSNKVIDLIVGDGWHSAPAFSVDGTELVTGNDGTIIVWDLVTFEMSRSIEAYKDQGYFSGINFSADGELLVTSTIKGDAKVWDFASLELLQSFLHPDNEPVRGASLQDALFLPDGKRVLGTGQYLVWLWDWQTGEVIWQQSAVELTNHRDIALSPDGETFLITFSDESPIVAQLRYVDTGNLIHIYRGHTEVIPNGDYSPDGMTVLTASNDGTVIIWPIRWDGAKLTAEVNRPVSVKWSPTRPQIAMVETSRNLPEDGFIHVIDSNTGETVYEFLGRRGDNYYTAPALEFSPDGNFLFSADVGLESWDVGIYVWDMNTGEQIYRLDGHEGWNATLAASHDNRYLAVGGTLNPIIGIWDLSTGERIHTLEGHQEYISGIVFGHDDQTLYSTSGDGVLLQWDLTSGILIKEIMRVDAQIVDLDIHPQNTHFLLGLGNGESIVVEAQDGEQVFTLRGHDNNSWVMDVVYTPLGDYIMTASRDGTVILWDSLTGDMIYTYVASTGTNLLVGTQVLRDLRADISPDGNSIVSVVNDQLTIWDLVTAEVAWETWIKNNHYIPDFTCEQRTLYQIEPLCETTQS